MVRALSQQEIANARVSVEAAERREGESFPDWMARGVWESQRNKLARVEAPPLVAGRWIRPCPSCGVASAEQDPLPNGQGNDELCISCWKKGHIIANFYQDVKRNRDARVPLNRR